MKKEIEERYLEERVERPRCERCQSHRIRPRAHTYLEFMADDWLYCEECEDKTIMDVETIEEWAERVDIDLEEL